VQTEPIRELVARSLREGAELRIRLIEHLADKTAQAAQVIHGALQRGGKILLFGNGGSAADAQHVAAEFVGRFAREREPMPAIALTTNTSILTALGNDYGFERVFARQILALGGPADVAIAISTSGRSPNVLQGVRAARDRRITTIGLTGGDGGRLARLVDIALVVPCTSVPRIQECHITLGHILCEISEILLLEEKKTRGRSHRRNR
jgi:D-sedoheptulose 7-phosphate isomerase